MSLATCLETAVGASEITADRAKVFQDVFNELRTKYRASMSDTAADAAAAADTKRIMRQQFEADRTRVAETILRARENKEYMVNFRDVKGRNDMAAAPIARVREADMTRRGLMTSLRRSLNNFAAKHGKNIAGQTRNKADLETLGRALSGEATGDANADALARGVRDTIETARRMFNSYGGNIRKLENWIPHTWNRAALKKADTDGWIDDMMQEVDWDRVIDPATDQPFGVGFEAEKRTFLSKALQTLRSDGYSKAEIEYGMVGAKAMANRRSESRILHFKDYDAWARVNAKYGGPDLFDSIVGYLDTMARDIALMKTFGPNPSMGLTYMRELAKQQAETGASPMRNAESRATRLGVRAENMLSHIDGSANVPVNEWWANFMAGTRHSITAARLGAAMLSSASDAATVSFAARYRGLGASDVLSTAVRGMAGGATRRDLDVVAGVVETALDTAAGVARFTNDLHGPEITRRLSAGVIRASGLSHWTDNMKDSLRGSFLGMLATYSGRGMDRLPEPVRNLFSQWGITSDDWNLLRTAKWQGETGEFIIPDMLRTMDVPERQAFDVAAKMNAAIEQIVEEGVPSRDLEGLAFLAGDLRPGTFWGEMARSGMSFKHFSVSLFSNQIRRVMAEPTLGGKVAYVVKFSAAMTVLGALAVQLKELSKGREPMDMTTPEFWGAAYMQGGGAGIMGDFLYSGSNRFGGGFMASITGPVVGLGQDVFTLTLGNLIDLAQGKDTKFGRDLANFIRYNTPGGSLWYARLVLDRMVFDQIQKILDPEAERYFRQQEARQMRDRGNASIWERGDILPVR